MGNSTNDWRSSLTASERYDNIQRLTKSIAAAGLTQSAFSLENEAYKNCNSREEYDAACSLSFDPPEPIIPTSGEDDEPAHLASRRDDLGDEAEEYDSTDTGTKIGPYGKCHYIASGITAEVYRCKDRALKVIVETRDIEPHNPAREARMLGIFSQDQSSRNIIPLLETFRDQEQRFVLGFPYMPLTLAAFLEKSSAPLSNSQITRIFSAVFGALQYIHSQGIIHRDIKPSAVLLSSTNLSTDNNKYSNNNNSHIYLSDFGTAWHPTLSSQTEPGTNKILDIGTGPYRAPEVLFGNKSYSTPIDMWATGVMLSECCSPTGKPLFESRPVHEDGNQLGLILSIFKTIGSPTKESWPEAASFRTPPFEMYRFFEGRKWEDILPGVEEKWRGIVARLVKYESGSRASAEEMVSELLSGGGD